MSTTAVRPEARTATVATRLRKGASRGYRGLPLAGGLVGDKLRWAVCTVPVVGLLVLWAADNGGYDSVTWLAGGIGLTVLAMWIRVVLGAGPRLGRFGRIAMLALATYVAWSFASIAWATDKGAAMLGSDRALLYLLLFWLFAGLEFTYGRLRFALTGYLLALGGLAVAILFELATGPAPHLLILGQLAAGLGYHNATAALGTIGTVGATLLSSSRAQRPLTRAGLIATAAACLELSLLAQSRGWLYTLPVIAVIVLATSPRPGRVVLWAAVPVIAALTTLPWLQRGWALADGSGSPSHQTVAAADVATARAALVAVLVAGLAGWLVARLQQRYVLARRGRRVARWCGRVSFAVAAVAAAAGGVFLVTSGKFAHAWHQFSTNAPVSPGVSRFAELSSSRYDLWRVAVRSFLNHPIGGLGQDNFAQAYLANRRTSEEPLWVHSLELRLLAHTGAVGFVLFCAFVVCALVAYRRAVRDADRKLRLVLAAALVPLVVWMVHGSVDWFWEIPALSGAAFVFLGAAAALEPGRRTTAALQPGQPTFLSAAPEPRPRRRSAALVQYMQRLAATLSAARRTATTGLANRGWLIVFARPAALVTAATFALLAFVPAYLGERALDAGQALADTNPSAALNELTLASRLEPLSSAPGVLAAAIELRADRGSKALSVARSDLRRDPGAWLLWFEYALAAGRVGNTALEHSALDRAHALDPREPVVALAQRRAGTQHPLTITEAARILSARAQDRVQP